MHFFAHEQITHIHACARRWIYLWKVCSLTGTGMGTRPPSSERSRQKSPALRKSPSPQRFLVSSVPRQSCGSERVGAGRLGDFHTHLQFNSPGQQGPLYNPSLHMVKWGLALSDDSLHHGPCLFHPELLLPHGEREASPADRLGSSLPRAPGFEGHHPDPTSLQKASDGVSPETSASLSSPPEKSSKVTDPCLESIEKLAAQRGQLCPAG